MKKGSIFIITSIIFCLSFSQALAATKFQIDVWVPYWAKTVGVGETVQHLSTLSEVSPFGYTVDSNGNLLDTAKITQSPWTSLYGSIATSSSNTKVIPTISWADPNAIYNVLSNPTTMTAQIN